MREAIESGLDRVDKLKPGQGFLDFSAGARGEGASVVGFARAEVGAKVTTNGSVFAFGEGTIDSRLLPSWSAGVGARFSW